LQLKKDSSIFSRDSVISSTLQEFAILFRFILPIKKWFSYPFQNRMAKVKMTLSAA